MRYTEKPRIKGNRGKLSLTNRVPSAITDIVDGGFFAFREFVLPFHSGAGFALVIHGILIQLNKFLFPACQRCLRIPLLNQMLVQLYLERQEVQELFVLHLQIPDNPGQEIISGEIVHFSVGSRRGYPGTALCTKPVREPISRGKSSSLRSVTSTSSTGPLA